MRRRIIVFLMLCLFLIIYIYVYVISSIPSDICVLQGDEIDLKHLFGLNYFKDNNKVLEVSSIEKENVNYVQKVNLNVNLFNNICVKKVSVDVIPKNKVIPLGNAIGLKIYTKGVLVVGLSEIEGKKPFENTGIVEGTRIIEVNNSSLSSSEELVKKINESKGNEINIKYVSLENEEKQVSVLPVKTSKNDYKLGLWVRDAAAGVGTLSFYEPESRNVCFFRTWYCRY